MEDGMEEECLLSVRLHGVLGAQVVRPVEDLVITKLAQQHRKHFYDAVPQVVERILKTDNEGQSMYYVTKYPNVYMPYMFQSMKMIILRKYCFFLIRVQNFKSNLNFLIFCDRNISQNNI